jgi:hypothetical protein
MPDNRSTLPFINPTIRHSLTYRFDRPIPRRLTLYAAA